MADLVRIFFRLFLCDAWLHYYEKMQVRHKLSLIF